MKSKKVVGRFSNGKTDMLETIVELVYDPAGRSIGIRLQHNSDDLAIDFDQEDIKEFIKTK